MTAAGAIDVCNFDASGDGGPTEWRRVASLAASFDVQLGDHEEAQVASHLLASVPHVVEASSPTRDPICQEMRVNCPALVDWLLPLPATPGFGWELDHEFTERSRVDR